MTSPAFDPELWDEELLHAGLSNLGLDGESPEPLRELREGLTELLVRPIDEDPNTIGGRVHIIPGTLAERTEHELSGLPPHAVVVLVDDLEPLRFLALPLASTEQEVAAALELAHGGTLGDPVFANPRTYPSVLRIAAGIIEPDQAEEFWAVHVLDWFEDWQDEDVALPSLAELHSWAGALRPCEITEASGFDICISRVCAVYVT